MSTSRVTSKPSKTGGRGAVAEPQQRTTREAKGEPKKRVTRGAARARSKAPADEVDTSRPKASGARAAKAISASPLTGPAIGAPAPQFTLTSDTGEQVSLADHRGRWVVLFFYPKDHTPGCTREACAFQAASAELAKKGAVVLGVSRDSVASHVSFKLKQGLKFALLSDPAADTHKLYGAFGEKMMYGKKVVGAIRTTALVGPDGTLAKVYSPVKVDGHAEDVLGELTRAAGGSR